MKNSNKPVAQAGNNGQGTRVAQFRGGELYVNGVKVPWIPCRRCQGKGVIEMGRGFDAGLARCAPCEGKGMLTAQDVIRNQQFRITRLAEKSQQAKDITAEFEKIYQLRQPTTQAAAAGQ